MQEVLEGEAESCKDETIAMEPSTAEPENEEPELQPQVGKSFMFLTVLLYHCCRAAYTRVMNKDLQRSSWPPRKEKLCYWCLLCGNQCCIDTGDFFALFRRYFLMLTQS